ncbi:MAG: cysteine--tRNA ligase [Nitrospirae bacterium]|nr:cysteine--tRNA ligase [Nitrospirota bacterium]
MKIYNTLTAKKEEFIPLSQGKVKMYVCGVTVYDYCHIGHARSAVVFDVINRYLRYKGYDVIFVKNFTDLDDKIINKAKQEGVSWDTVARKYTDEYYKDMDVLRVGKPDLEPKATEHIEDMIEIIKVLIDKGYAYELDGSVYFEVGKFLEYGKLSKRNTEELIAGARIEVDERKKNPMDFALWKRSKEGEPAWDSPWGAGRPGWHIECSAMSIKHLGDEIDIHGGGADLIFPHHENEIAQSESFTGKPFAKYWVHNGFITINREKMSKSLGNFFTVKEILDKFDPEVLRLFLLSTHYRSPIEFSDDQLRETEISLDRYYSTILRVNSFLEECKIDRISGKTQNAFETNVSQVKKRFEEAMDDDFNTALALGHIFEFMREINRFIDSKPSGMKVKELLQRSKEVLSEFGGVLNIFVRTPEEWYRSLISVKKIGLSEKDIDEKIKVRQDARKKRQWDVADRIRKELEEKGVILEDKEVRTDWRVRVGV